MRYFNNLVIAVAVLLEPVAAEAISSILGLGSFPSPWSLLGNLLVVVGTVGVVYRPVPLYSTPGDDHHK